MWAQERHKRIQGLLHRFKQMSADDLARDLDVSRETVRRDLLELESAGLLKRVHGGAVLPEPLSEAPFADRLQVRRKEKQAIARAAIREIKPGQVCFVDAGSTTAILAEELGKIAGLTIVTNSIDVANTLNGLRQDITTLLLGGRLHNDVPGTYGELTLSEVARFRADVAILSPVGVHPEHGATDFVLHEAEIARAMIQQSQRVVFLADHAKIGTASRVAICPCSRIDLLITDAAADRKTLAALRQAGLGETILAD